jgi:hypothetical protein
MGQIITVNIDSQFISTVLLQSDLSANLKYRISRDGTIWTDWIDFVPVKTTFRYIDFQVILSTTDIAKTPEVNIFKINIDVPDIMKYGVSDIAVGGTDVSYGYTYWTDSDNQNPIVTATAIEQGKRAEVISVGVDKVRIRVLNASGNDVGGKVNWIVIGY